MNELELKLTGAGGELQVGNTNGACLLHPIPTNPTKAKIESFGTALFLDLNRSLNIKVEWGSRASPYKLPARGRFILMNKAVILAAGKGTRLYPVTHHIAKPLLPIANRVTLFYAFDRLKELNITDICLVVGEQNQDQMKTELGDGSSAGVNLTYVVQTSPQGLAHALGFAKDFVANDPFVLYLGDAIYSEPFNKFLDDFTQNPCANLSIVKEVPNADRFGVAVFDDKKVVSRLEEKSAKPPSNFAMAGLYFFGSEIWSVLPNLQPSARGEYEITDAIQLLVDGGKQVRAGVYEGQWFDTGTLDSFLATSQFLTGGKPMVDSSAKVLAAMSRNTVIGKDAFVECNSVEGSVILPGAKIVGNFAIRNSIVGGHCILQNDIFNEIMWGTFEEISNL